MSDVREAPAWFLERGLPSAVSRRDRWRGVLPRSAPALVAWAVLMVCSLFVAVASRGREIDLDDDTTVLQWIVLVVFIAIPPLMLLGGWLASRVRSARARTIAAAVAVVVAFASDWWGDDLAGAVVDTVHDAAVPVAILLATGTGVGAVLAWALRMTVRHVRSAGRLMVRALPVVLLTVLVFFNSTVWTIAANLGGGRLALLLAVMAALALSFVAAGVVDAVRAMLRTPFDDLEAEATPFTTGEKVNVVVVSVVSQVVQLAILAAVTGGIFFVLGLIVLNPAVLGKLAPGHPGQGVWFGAELPVPGALVHMTLFLTALTFMYVSARAVGDGEYKREFLDPLLAELRVALAARHRYRGLRTR